jgi:DNA polymerase (family X)
MRIPGIGPKKAAAYPPAGRQDAGRTEASLRSRPRPRVEGLRRQDRAARSWTGSPIAATAGSACTGPRPIKSPRPCASICKPVRASNSWNWPAAIAAASDTVGDLDILIVAAPAGGSDGLLRRLSRRGRRLARGDTKMSVRLAAGLQIDLRVVPPSRSARRCSISPARRSPQRRSPRPGEAARLKINEYGVFRVEGERETYVAGAAEEDVYAALDLPCFPPELREARREFEWAGGPAARTGPLGRHPRRLARTPRCQPTARRSLEEMAEPPGNGA